MGRRSKVKGKTRSELIREYLQENPDAGPKTVVEALKEQGVDVSEGLVGQVKYKPENKTPQPITADDLIALKEFAIQLGGIERLREAVDKLEEVFSGSHN